MKNEAIAKFKFQCSPFAQSSSFPNDSFFSLNVKSGNFKRAKHSFEMLPASCFLIHIFEMLRSLNVEKMGSVNQRAAKLPSLNFDNDSYLVRVEPGPTGLNRAGAEWQTFS